MATNKSNESIDDEAFQALEDALKIDFDELKSALNEKTSLDDPEGKVSEPVKQAPTPNQAKSVKPQQARRRDKATDGTVPPDACSDGAAEEARREEGWATTTSCGERSCARRQQPARSRRFARRHQLARSAAFVALGRLQPVRAEATHADPGQDPRDR